MHHLGPIAVRRLPTYALILSLCMVFTAPAKAQDDPDPVKEGYITAVDSPTSFEVDDSRVLMTGVVIIETVGGKKNEHPALQPDTIQAGVWVQVFGVYDAQRVTIDATKIKLRDDSDQRLSGSGVIQSVLAASPMPVYEADGYRIRLATTTKVSFQDDLKSLSDVAAGCWIHYEGKRDQDGTLVASKVQFSPAKPAKFKVMKGLEETPWRFEPPRASLSGDAATGKAVSTDPSAPPNNISDRQAVLTQNDNPQNDNVDGSIRFGTMRRMYKVPADQAMQARIRRLGMSLVPAYQKQLPAGDPAKINFQFYFFDAPKIRTEINSDDGVILVPMQFMERLKSDDQIAAVLADGVAYNLERQAARQVSYDRIVAGAGAASALIPGGALAGMAAGAAFKKEMELPEQRGRVALALMSDAGYDPWTAPEAWRLLAPKKLPADMSKVKYPEQSGYQFGILHFEYKKHSQPYTQTASTTPSQH